jgi:hypothetical protein
LATGCNESSFLVPAPPVRPTRVGAHCEGTTALIAAHLHCKAESRRRLDSKEPYVCLPLSTSRLYIFLLILHLTLDLTTPPSHLPRRPMLTHRTQYGYG